MEQEVFPVKPFENLTEGDGSLRSERAVVGASHLTSPLHRDRPLMFPGHLCASCLSHRAPSAGHSSGRAETDQLSSAPAPVRPSGKDPPPAHLMEYEACRRGGSGESPSAPSSPVPLRAGTGSGRSAGRNTAR